MILILIIHYFNQDEVISFCRHINETSQYRGEIDLVITDNSGDFKDNVDLPSNVYLAKPGTNLGYVNGCSFGLRFYSEKTAKQPDYICISNTDITFVEGLNLPDIDSLPHDIGCLAPKITLPNNRNQNPNLLERPSKAALERLHTIYSIPLFGAAYIFLSEIKAHLNIKRKPEALANTAIYSAHGSCFFLTKHFFRSGGQLSYGSFIYDEEHHIAEQLRQHSLKILYYPATHIRHVPHSTLGLQSFYRRSKFHQQSMGWIIDTYFSADE